MTKRIRIIVDCLMSVILLLLMAYQVTGNKYHEWLGAGMLLLFLIHNGLNYKWYKVLFKGKWPPQRIGHTVITLSMLISFVVTAYGGIEMSREVFSFLPDLTRAALARKIHLAGSYWTFTLTGLHMGVHWSQMTAILRKKLERKRVLRTVLLVASFAVAILGAVLFVRAGIWDYMLLKREYVTFDYETAPILIFLENAIMLWGIGTVGHLLMRTLKRIGQYLRKNRQSHEDLDEIK